MDIISLKKTHQKISKDIIFFAMLLVAVSLFFSRFLISIGFIIVFANWIFEGRFKEKFDFIKNNKVGFYILLLWLFHIIGLLHTENIVAGLDDVRTKSFLLIILAYGSGTQLSSKRKNIVFYVYILSAVLATIISSLNFYFGNETAGIEDLGGISLVGGNLYQAILVNFAISLLCYFVISTKNNKYTLLYYISILWFIIYLFLLNSLTGYLLFFILFIYNSVYFFFKQKKTRNKFKIITTFLLTIILLSTYTGLTIKDFYTTDNINYKQLPKTTINGNTYTHYTISKQQENGHFLHIYLCEKELQKEWNKRSVFDYNGLDNKQQNIAQTLIRYLSSKNLTKDSVGVWALHNTDIQFIENGYANYLYTNKYSLKARLYIVIWQLDKYYNQAYANRQTISQRIVYTKTAFELIKKHFWTGVGPGDVRDESRKYIADTNSGLTSEYSNRVHIQFLVEFIGLGIFGFLGFIFIIFYPYFKNKLWQDYLFTSFYLLIIFGCFSAFLFESQIGITFFSFFYSMMFLKKQYTNLAT